MCVAMQLCAADADAWARVKLPPPRRPTVQRAHAQRRYDLLSFLWAVDNQYLEK